LCTAGYGLAKANWEYFGGAMYLFTINTIFIALATFLVLKLLRFPMLKYANSKKRKRIGNIATFIAIVVMVPAVWTFLNVLKESRFNHDAKTFIANELEGLPNANYIKKNAVYFFNPQEGSRIEITTFGSDEISEDTEALLKRRLVNYNMLLETKLIINQATFREVNNLEYMEELRSRDSLDLLSKQQKIHYLENKVAKLSILERDQIPFDEVIKEIKINYENLEQFSYSNKITSNFKSIDTVKVFNVKWIDSLTTEENKIKDEERIAKFLKERLDLDSLIVRRYN
ncbi:MAG: hypothetical protein KJN82_05690, partial [Bacteroidia bacterium]|nr:hypothetical protein [Bacteroidia bacterium]